MITINKASIGKKYFAVLEGEMANRSKEQDHGFVEMTFLTVGTKYVTITDYSDKEQKPTPQDCKFRISHGSSYCLKDEFDNDLIYLMGSYNWSCYFFEDKEKCIAFIAKNRLINNIVSNFDIYDFKDKLAKQDMDTLKIVNDVFKNQPIHE